MDDPVIKHSAIAGTTRAIDAGAPQSVQESASVPRRCTSSDLSNRAPWSSGPALPPCLYQSPRSGSPCCFGSLARNTIRTCSERDGATESRAGLLARALEARGEPFVLALDDLHRLKDREAVALLDFLIQRGPPNLHLAAACRRLPAGLNIAGPVLDGQAAVLGADDLRFSKSEISDFFDRRLSRRELGSLAEESAGWPMALRMQRNRTGVTRGAGEARSIVENWVESRLWEGIDADDRELVLDVGLFEWIDEELLNEVLGGNDSIRRIQTMEALVGFLEPVRGSGADAWRLHPLIAEHCALQRFRDARERFREVHRRIAIALARRGETLLALRHGTESGDVELAGDVVEEAGGIRLWLRFGLAQFRAAIELLDGSVLQARPRLRIARCAALLFSGRLEQARQIYGSIDREVHLRPESCEEAAFERWLDFCILRGIVINRPRERTFAPGRNDGLRAQRTPHPSREHTGGDAGLPAH